MNLKQLVDDTIKNIRGQAMQRTTQTLANVQRGIGTAALNMQTGVGNVRAGFAPIVNPLANTLKQGSQAFGRLSYSTNPINVVANNQQRQQQVLGTTLPKYSASKQSFQDILTAGKGKLATAGLLQSPLSVGTFGATSAGFQGLSNIVNKKPITQGMPQALGQGLNMGAIANPIIKATNPILLKGMNKLPFSNQLATRTAAGIGNVLQGEVLGKSGMGNSALSRGIDFGVGFIGGKGTFQNPIPKNVEADYGDFVRKMHNVKGAGTQLIFKPHKPMATYEIDALADIYGAFKQDTMINKEAKYNLKEILKRVTDATDDRLNKMTDKQLINEVARHAAYSGEWQYQRTSMPAMGFAAQKPKDAQAPKPQSTVGGVKVYHGSRDKIDQFDLNHLNATYMHDGLGVNFTDNPDFAKMYSSGKNEWGELNKINDGKGFVYERTIPKDANILDVSSKSKKVSDVLSLNDFIDIASKGRDKQFARKNLERTARNYLTSLDNNMGSLEATTKASSMTDEQLLKIAYDRLKDKTFANGEGLPDVFRSLIDTYGIKSDDMADVVRQFSKKTGIDVIKTRKPDGSSVYTVLSPEKLANVAQAPVSDINLPSVKVKAEIDNPDILHTLVKDNGYKEDFKRLTFTNIKAMGDIRNKSAVSADILLDGNVVLKDAYFKGGVKGMSKFDKQITLSKVGEELFKRTQSTPPAPVSGMAQGTSQQPFNQLPKNLKLTDAYSDSFLGYNLKGMEKKAKEQGYDLYKALLDRVDSQGTVDAKIKGMESILDDLSGKPVSGAVKNQNALVKTGKPGALVTQQSQLPSTKPTQTDALLPQRTPSQSVNPQTGLPGGGQIPPKLNTSGQTVGGNQTKDLSYKVTDRLYTEFVDRFHPISKLAKVAGKDKETARAIAGYYGSGSTANYHLQQELSPILKEQNITDLKEAAIAMRDVELSSRGIKGSPEQVLSQKKLQDLTNRLGPQKMQELGATLQKLYAYQDEMVKKYLVDTGIMSQSSYQAMRKNNQFYVPMKRVMDQVDDFLGIPIKRGAGSMGKQNVIYGIKGSDKEIIDPIESIVENTYKLVSLGKRQEVAQTISGLRKEMPNVITRALKSDQQNTIGVFENGKKVFYNVPEEVADAARGMGEEQLVTLTKILKVPTDLFRTMTTGVNPEFLMPNVSRDTQSALFNAGVNPLKWVSGLAHFLKQDQVYKDFLKSGGKTSRISINRPYLKQTAEELAGKGFSIKSPKDIVRGLEMLSEVSEQPTRIAVFEDAYKRSLKQGMSQEEALREAAYWAQEGTVNFARRGSKMTNINAIYAYLNARVQGVDRMLRTAKKEPGKAVVRWGFGMLAPSLALYAWNNSGERGNRYNDERILSKRDKEDNFIFMLPQTKNGVDYLKIPKSEIAKVVNPIETYLDFARGKGGDIAGSVASLVKSFSPIDNVGGLIPTAINPVVENAMNKDFYTGYDLVPEYKKSLPKGYQDSNYTSPVFRMIGQKTNQSPALLQNLAESYGGGMVRIAEMASQPLIDKKYVSAKNEQGAEINRTPVLRRFMGGEKKTETEQIKANISKQNAIKFQINDVKSAIRRGDIPADVGYQQIVKLMGEMPVTQPTTQPTHMKQVSIPTVKQTPIPMPTGKGIGGGKRKKISIKKPKQIKIKLKGFKKATQRKMKAVKIKKPKNIRIVTDKTKKA